MRLLPFVQFGHDPQRKVLQPAGHVLVPAAWRESAAVARRVQLRNHVIDDVLVQTTVPIDVLREQVGSPLLGAYALLCQPSIQG